MCFYDFPVVFGFDYKTEYIHVKWHNVTESQ